VTALILGCKLNTRLLQGLPELLLLRQWFFHDVTLVLLIFPTKPHHARLYDTRGFVAKCQIQCRLTSRRVSGFEHCIGVGGDGESLNDVARLIYSNERTTHTGIEEATAKYIRVIWLMVVHEIWTLRNEYGFSGKVHYVDVVVDDVKLKYWLWLKHLLIKGFVISFVYWDNNPCGVLAVSNMGLLT
jgi:hypothetical protein